MKELLKICIPTEILEHFEYCYMGEFMTLKTKESGFVIYLEEKNILPDGYSIEEYESKGFSTPMLVQDFPLRGKQIFFSIRKRRWREKNEKGKIIRKDFSFLADQSKMTAELVAFLKDTGREPSRYDVEYL